MNTGYPFQIRCAPRRGPTLALVLCGVLHLLPAAPLPVVNPGFENITGEAPFNEFTFGPLIGWSLYDPGLVTDGGDGPNYYIGTLRPWIPDPINFPGVFNANFPGGPVEGTRVGIAFNFSYTGGQGPYGFSQTLTNSTLQSNTTYTLQVEIGNIASGFASNNTYFLLQGFPGYRVDLLAGGEVVAQDNNSLAGSIPEGQFANSTVVFHTGDFHPRLGQSLGIRLVNLNVIDPTSTNSDLEVDFDHVRLDATPAATALAAFRAVHGLATNGSQDLLTPANDGVVNLQKYAFNLIGTNAGQAVSLAVPNSAIVTTNGVAGLPRVGMNATLPRLELTYIRRKTAAQPGVTYVVEWSNTLEPGSWAANPAATENVTSVNAVYERVVVTDSLGTAHRFARVRVTVP